MPKLDEVGTSALPAPSESRQETPFVVILSLTEWPSHRPTRRLAPLVKAGVSPDFSFAVAGLALRGTQVTDTYGSQDTLSLLQNEAHARQARRVELLNKRRISALTVDEASELRKLQAGELARLDAELGPGTDRLRQLLPF